MPVTQYTSPTRYLFNLAWSRLWPANSSGWLEILYWSMLACYLGFLTNRYVSSLISYWISVAAYLFIAVGTIFYMGWAVYSSYIRFAGKDELLKTLPLTPAQQVMPVLGAVLLSWLRTFAPWVIMFVMSFNEAVVLGEDVKFEWLDFVLQQLSLFNVESIVRLSFVSIPDAGHVIFIPGIFSHYSIGIFNQVMPSDIVLIFMFGLLQIYSWIVFPLIWAIYWGIRIRNNVTAYILLFSSYIILPACLTFLVNRYGDAYIIREWLYIFGTSWVLNAALVGTIGLFIAGFILVSTFRIYMRRQT